MSALSPIQPAVSDIIAMIEANPKLQPSTKAQYKKALSGYLKTGNSLTDADALSAYAATLNKSSKAFLKAAVRLWGDSVALKAKSNATPDNISAVQATVYRIEALNEAIQIKASKGQKAHSWLTQSEVKRLLDTCNTRTTQGKRDKVVLGLLVAAGLRREEAISITFDDMLIQPVGNKHRTVLNVKGKGAKDRIVPISDKLAQAIKDWHEIAGNGYIARSVTKGDAIGKTLSAIGVFKIVAKAGHAIGKPELAPHDLRRTYAQLGYESGVSIVQISKLLGHSSVATTQRYLNLDLDLSVTVSDFVPF